MTYLLIFIYFNISVKIHYNKYKLFTDTTHYMNIICADTDFRNVMIRLGVVGICLVLSDNKMATVVKCQLTSSNKIKNTLLFLFMN